MWKPEQKIKMFFPFYFILFVAAGSNNFFQAFCFVYLRYATGDYISENILF